MRTDSNLAARSAFVTGEKFLHADANINFFDNRMAFIAAAFLALGLFHFCSK